LNPSRQPLPRCCRSAPRVTWRQGLEVMRSSRNICAEVRIGRRRFLVLPKAFLLRPSGVPSAPLLLRDQTVCVRAPHRRALRCEATALCWKRDHVDRHAVSRSSYSSEVIVRSLGYTDIPACLPKCLPACLPLLFACLPLLFPLIFNQRGAVRAEIRGTMGYGNRASHSSKREKERGAKRKRE
jgi:hypothetical protein